MKYLIIFAIVSIAGTMNIVSTAVENEQIKPIPIEYIDFEKTPIYITANV